jgi:hypothetical protein
MSQAPIYKTGYVWDAKKQACGAQDYVYQSTEVCVQDNLGVRPKVSGVFPDFVCPTPFVPFINNALNSNNPDYVGCYLAQEQSAQPQLEDPRKFIGGNRGQMSGDWCDDGSNCSSGQWCCRAPANTAKASNSGRCVYCHDNHAPCLFTTTGDVCPSVNMTGW